MEANSPFISLYPKNNLYIIVYFPLLTILLKIFINIYHYIYIT